MDSTPKTRVSLIIDFEDAGMAECFIAAVTDGKLHVKRPFAANYQITGTQVITIDRYRSPREHIMEGEPSYL